MRIIKERSEQQLFIEESCPADVQLAFSDSKSIQFTNWLYNKFRFNQTHETSGTLFNKQHQIGKHILSIGDWSLQ